MGRITENDLTPRMVEELDRIQERWLALPEGMRVVIDKRIRELIKQMK